MNDRSAFRLVLVLIVMLPVAAGLSACVQSEYYGDPHAPTERAVLFERMEDIDRPHEVIGRLVSIERMASQQAVIDAMRREASRRGADGLVVPSIERFAWSDLPGAAGDGLDPELDPIGTAIDSKLRWRGEAVLVRWAPTGEREAVPEGEPAVGDAR